MMTFGRHFSSSCLKSKKRKTKPILLDKSCSMSPTLSTQIWGCPRSKLLDTPAIQCQKQQEKGPCIKCLSRTSQGSGQWYPGIWVPDVPGIFCRRALSRGWLKQLRFCPTFRARSSGPFVVRFDRSSLLWCYILSTFSRLYAKLVTSLCQFKHFTQKWLLN